MDSSQFILISLLFFVPITGKREYETFSNYGVFNEDLIRSSIFTTTSIVKTIQWSSVLIIYSLDDDVMVTRMLQQFDLYTKQGLRVTTFDITKMSTFRILELLSQIYENGSQEVRIILFLNNQTLHFFPTANTYDDISNKTTNYQTNSKWILVNNAKREDMALDTFVKLRHVIFVTSRGAYVRYKAMTSEIRCIGKQGPKISDIVVNQCTMEDMYPNANYKLAGKRLLIGIKDASLNKIFEELTVTLSQALNFSYRFVQSSDHTYGVYKDGRWTGLVGQLVRREVDIVIDEFTITGERMKVIDFIQPGILPQAIGVIYRRGIEVEGSWYKLFKPLRPVVYVFTFATLFYVGTMLFLLDQDIALTLDLKLIRLVKVIIQLVGFITVRGDGIWSKMQSARLMVATFWFFSVVITAVYIGNLTAKITETQDKKPFNSLQELIKLPDWKWGVTGDKLITQIIRTSKIKVLQDTWEGIVKFNKTDREVLAPDVLTQMEHVMRTSEKYASILFDPKFYALNRNDCALATIKINLISNLYIGIAVSKNSYLKVELERVMAKLSDNGLLKMFNDIWYTDNRPTKCKVTANIRSTRLEDVHGVLLIVCSGLILSTLVLFIEILSKHSRRRK